ncbi:hypothetical protein [Dyella acidiphila]|uniref:Uncharacterized protein n=1 Tax=Dyella acidiphila TaxID=2775866 RepID=A0ABR9G734_9GAMM|nr:hypothetical protein [Dyella acidiphila]MBE1159859.1 hypothetical protein [Dyella acidiphila]
MRIGFAVRSAAGLLCVPLLVACGVRVVKEQAAASFVDTGQKALTSTRQFYQDLVNANGSYNSFRWAVDPQCPLLSPGERLTAPGLDDPTALPLAIERLPSGRPPRACSAYVAETCRHDAGGLRCHPAAGTVTANGFFCPSDAAQACAPALATADWKRVSRYSDNPLNPSSSYVSLADSDFSADTASIQILTKYLDSLAALARNPDQDLSTALGGDADALQALTQHLHPAATHKTATATAKTSSASSTAATSGATEAKTKGDLAAPLASLAGGIKNTISQGGSASAIAKVLRQPGMQDQVNAAIEQLARAVDSKFCTTQPVDALRSAADINSYLGFGYGPNDLPAREALVKQSIGYKSLVESNLKACEDAQQATAADPYGTYHPASPAAILLLGVKRANDALVKEIVNGELSDAQRKQALKISFDEFAAAAEQVASLATSLQEL